MKAAPEGVAMVKKKNSVAVNDLGATEAASIFVAVAEKIERKRRETPLRLMIFDDTKIKLAPYDPDFPIDITRVNLNGLTTLEMVLPGALMELGFNSTEDMQRFIGEEYPPETGAWKRIAELATLAKGDQWVKQSESAVAFLGMVEAIANRTMGGDSPTQILGPLSDFLKSEQARKNAQSKNGEARAWILNAWENRKDKGQSKAAFSKDSVHFLKQKFGQKIVEPETIARDWLPKAKK